MKKYTLIFLSLILSSLFSYAQEDDQNEKKPSPESYNIGDALTPLEGLYLPFNAMAAINIRVVDNKFWLFFVDQNNKIVKPLYSQGRIRGDNMVKNKVSLSCLLSQSGAGLNGGPFVKRPYFYRISLFLKEPTEFFKGSRFYTPPTEENPGSNEASFESIIFKQNVSSQNSNQDSGTEEGTSHDSME